GLHTRARLADIGPLAIVVEKGIPCVGVLGDDVPGVIDARTMDVLDVEAAPRGEGGEIGPMTVAVEQEVRVSCSARIGADSDNLPGVVDADRLHTEVSASAGWRTQAGCLAVAIAGCLISQIASTRRCLPGDQPGVADGRGGEGAIPARRGQRSHG